MDPSKYPMTAAMNAYTAAFGATVPAGVAKWAIKIPGGWDRMIRDLQNSVQNMTPIQDWRAYVDKLLVPSEQTS